MRRSGSDDTVSSHSTVKPLGQDPSLGTMNITDFLPHTFLSSTRKRPTLTMDGVQAFTESEAGKQKGYPLNHVPSWDKDPGGRSRRERRGMGVCVWGGGGGCFYIGVWVCVVFSYCPIITALIQGRYEPWHVSIQGVM